MCQLVKSLPNKWQDPLWMLIHVSAVSLSTHVLSYGLGKGVEHHLKPWNPIQEWVTQNEFLALSFGLDEPQHS